MLLEFGKWARFTGSPRQPGLKPEHESFDIDDATAMRIDRAFLALKAENPQAFLVARLYLVRGMRTPDILRLVRRGRLPAFAQDAAGEYELETIDFLLEWGFRFLHRTYCEL